MLIHLVSVLHHFVRVDLSFIADDRCATDWASIALLSPRKDTLLMENVHCVARERNSRVFLLKRYEAN